MKRTSTWIIAVTLALLANTVAADAPNLLSYQGRLTDPGGNPKNGTFTMQFCMFDAEACGTGNGLPAGAPWCETQNVTVTNGVFNVLLGSVTPLPTNLFEGGPSDASGPLRFLQVTVGGEPLCPRKRIVSAAYAIQANRDISARVVNSASVENILPNTNMFLPFDTEVWDTSNLHDTTANTTRLTAPMSGRYLVFAYVQWRINATGSRHISINRNGSEGIASDTRDAVSDPLQETNQTVSTIVELNAGDYVEVGIWHSSSGPTAINASGGAPAFRMVKLP